MKNICTNTCTNKKNFVPLHTQSRNKGIRALSSVGSERLPYKQRVGGSNPSAPTSLSLTLWGLDFQAIDIESLFFFCSKTNPFSYSVQDEFLFFFCSKVLHFTTFSQLLPLYNHHHLHQFFYTIFINVSLAKHILKRNDNVSAEIKRQS